MDGSGPRTAHPVGKRLVAFTLAAFSRPGAAALAFIALYAGSAGLLHIGTATDALTTLLPNWFTTTLNCIYTLAGIHMIVGMGRKRGNVEAAGWIMLAASVIVRAIAVLTVAGLNAQVVGLQVLYIGFLAAAVVRIVQIVRGDDIVVVHVGRRT